MQKVEGSNPFSRFARNPALQRDFVVQAGHPENQTTPAFTSYEVPGEVEALRQLLHDAVAQLPSETRALPVFLRGVPTIELVSAVANGIDLMVIGSRRGGPLRRHMHGSVSNVMLAEARCPLLIIPSGVAAPSPETAVGDSGFLSAV